MRRLLSLIILASAAGSAVAQAPAQAGTTMPAAAQIASAVLPLPNDLRAGATVLGYNDAGALVPLRRGTGSMVCLADNPKEPRFHVACYHVSLEPFMERGRSLRADGIQGERVDTVRFAEITAGKLAMPKQPAMLYSITSQAGGFDAASGEITGGRRLFVAYMPFATAESTGLSAQPVAGAPWIMFPGTAKAHIMFTPTM